MHEASMILVRQPSRKSLGRYDMQEEDVQTGSASQEITVKRTMQRMRLPDGALEPHTGEDDATGIDGSLE